MFLVLNHLNTLISFNQQFIISLCRPRLTSKSLGLSSLVSIYVYWGRRVIQISESLIWSKTLMKLIFRWSLEFPVTQIHSPHPRFWTPGIFSDHLKSVQMLKREWGAESNGKPPHLLIPSKTATLVPEFAVEGLPFSRTAAFIPEFAVKLLGRTLWWWYFVLYFINYTIELHKRGSSV